MVSRYTRVSDFTYAHKDALPSLSRFSGNSKTIPYTAFHRNWTANLQSADILVCVYVCVCVCVYIIHCVVVDKTVMSMAEGSVSVIQCTTGCRYICNLEECNPVLSVLIDDRNGGRKEILKYSTDSSPDGCGSVSRKSEFVTAVSTCHGG